MTCCGLFQRHIATQGCRTTPTLWLPGTAGFCNALDDLLASAQVWIHGHLHCPFDYRHTPSGCRVLANPLGFAKKGEQVGFRPQAVVEV